MYCKKICLTLIALLLGFVTLPASGQGAPPQMDPAMMQQMMAQIQQRVLDNVKTQLDVSDEEFQVLQPKLEKLIQLRFAGLMSSGMGMGFAGARGFNLGQPPTELQKASTDLRDTLDNKDSSADLITTKVAALRTARAHAQEEMTKAQDDLRQLLTQRQEAVLVTMSFLD